MKNNNQKFKGFIRKIILTVLLAAGVTGGTFAYLLRDVKQEVQEKFTKGESLSLWTPYSSTDSRFKVQFPEEPSEQAKTLDIPAANQSIDFQQISAEAKEKEIVYTLSYIEFPRKWRLLGNNTLLNKALDLLVEYEMKGQQLLNKEITKHQSLPAIDYVMKQGEKEVQGRLIVVGTTLFRLTVTYPPALKDKIQHERFVESFQVAR